MDYSDSENPINDLPDQIKTSINARIDLYSLFIIKKLNKLIPLFILGLVLGFIFLFFTLFLSHAFIAWYEDYIGKGSTAALIVSGFYLLLGIILFVFRKQILYNPIQKGLVSELNFKEIHPSSEIGKISCNEDIDTALESSKLKSEEADDDLGFAINELKYYYTFDSIKSRFFTNIVENPKPLIGAILQGFMSVQSFKSKRRKKRQEP
ncbi:MAG: phage holin family protein [Bacteroidales bacterium]|nr:phage holin family protein [Bacteroidales bacterium]